MRKLRASWFRLLGIVGVRYQQDEFAEELDGHLAMHIEDNLHAGMSADEARRQALIKLGGLQQTKERYEDQRGLPALETLRQDVRFGLRMLWKSPGFTIIAVLTLALGIGANTAIFSIVNSVLLNPLPFPQPEQLVILHESKPNFERGSISYPNFQDWRKDNHSFSSMATSRGFYFGLNGMGAAKLLDGEYMTADYFETLGVKPLIGRTFTHAEEEPGAAPVVLISEGLWRRTLGADRSVLGKSISLDTKIYTIVGVIPASFRFTNGFILSRDVYVPMGQWNNPGLMNRNAGRGMRGIARLRPGVSLEQAAADMRHVTRDLTLAYPDVNKGIGATLVPLKEQMVGDVRPFLLILLAAVGFVLLIATVNVASLMLARSTGRMREFAIRAALGASRKRVVRQLLTESLMLAAGAGVLGLLLAAWGTHAGLKLLPEALPRAEEIGLDMHVLAFTLLVALLTGVSFGLVPALKMSQADPHTALKEGGRGTSGGRHRAQNTFIVVETAMALVLLTGAGLMVRSLVRLWHVDPGFDAHNVLTFGYTMPPSMSHAAPATIRAAYRDFNNQLASMPEVEASSQSWGSMPMAGDSSNTFWIDGQPKPGSSSDMNETLSYIVGPDYLKVMRIPLKRGRFFTPHDDEKSPNVAVIDEVFAQKFFPQENPIGKRILMDDTEQKIEIVGVTGHIKQWGLDADDTQKLRAELFLPYQQMPDTMFRKATGGIDEIVRYRGYSETATAGIRRIIGERSGEQIVYDVQTMESMIADSLAQQRFIMILLGIFAILALLLASIGIYGVTAYVVGQRTQEIGIRMALGAQRIDVLRLTLWQGMRFALAGIGIGIAAAALLTRVMASMLFGISATDPVTFCGVALILAAIAAAACYAPARRATRVDPMSALRTD